MFRFLMMLVLMALSFFAGKMSAQEEPDFEVIYEQPVSAGSISEILALVRNPQLQSQFPDLHHNLIVFLATRHVQEALLNPNRSDSAVYQQLQDLVDSINTQLL